LFNLNDDIHIWCLGLSDDSELFTQCFPLLSKDEKERADKFKFSDERDSFIHRRGALRRILGRYLEKDPGEILFNYGKFGKPFVIDHPLHFNLSHSKDQVIFAVSRKTPLGIDIERIKEDVDYLQVAQHFFSPSEVAGLNVKEGIELRRSFYRCWTTKEAFIKAIGEGLSFPLNQFDVSIDPNESAAILEIRNSNDSAERWTIKDLKVPDNYAGALAYRSREKTVRYVEWNE